MYSVLFFLQTAKMLGKMEPARSCSHAKHCLLIKVVPYLCWPWRLANVIDPRLPRATRIQVARAFMSARHCCLDPGCGERLQKLVRCPEDLLEGGRFYIATKTIFINKCLNIELEDNFARSSGQRQAERGKVSTNAAQACKHVLEYPLIPNH
jgi:hypothetical protein